MEFFDTNVLVYTVDRAETIRRPIALELVRKALASRSLVISTQVMLEFYATALRKNLTSPAVATELLREWAEGAVSMTPDLLWRAFDIQQKLRFSLWDAAIVQAALDSGCSVLYTEDLQDGQRIGPLKVINPFREEHKVHEPLPRHSVPGPVGAASQVDRLLRRAIRLRRLVQLMYGGMRRVGEPHDYGLRNGKPQLNFHQTGGESKSGTLNSWRSLDAGKISELEILDSGFAGSRDTPTNRHLKWDEVYASVSLQPTRKRR